MRETLNRLEEAKTKNPYAKIAKMTDYNDHTGAIVAAAKMLSLKSVVDRAKLVDKLHDLEGGMPAELIKYRTSLYNELLAHAKKKLSPEEYDQLHGAF